jgi:hypothetical protein
MESSGEARGAPSAKSAQHPQFWLVAVSMLGLVATTVLATVLFMHFLPALSTRGSAEQKLTAAQQAAIDRGISAVGKLNAAVEVGVNFQNYGALLIDAKAATNHAVELAPGASATNLLQATMQNYADAAEAWQFKIRAPNLKLNAMWGNGALLQKYALQPSSSDDEGVDPDLAMQKIWMVAARNYRSLTQAQSGAAEP